MEQLEQERCNFLDLRLAVIAMLITQQILYIVVLTSMSWLNKISFLTHHSDLNNLPHSTHFEVVSSF